MPRPPIKTRPALTLLELLVVIAVLAVLAGLVLPRLTGVGDYAARQATKTTLNTVREGIIGADHRPGYVQDMETLPSTLASLFLAPINANLYDPVTGHGWHGPYLQDAPGKYAINPSIGFTSEYGAANDPAPVDGWNHPIILQIPPDPTYARLVSAGPDGIIQTPANISYPTTNPTNERGDDLVLFLTRPDLPPSP